MTDARVTADGLDVTHAGDPKARASAADVDVTHTGDPAARVTDAIVDAFDTGDPKARVSAAHLEAYNGGDPYARVTQVVLEVYRSIRAAPFPVFPVRLFCPPSLSARLAGGGVSGGDPLAGDAAVAAMDAGGLWTMEFGETPLLRRDQVLTWRALAAAADWGATAVIVPLWDRRHQPLDPVAYTGASTFGEDLWHDALHWEIEQVTAELTAITQAGATSLTWTHDGPVRPQAGQHFSILGPHWGWRLYRLIRIDADDGETVTAEIRPPLREWANVRTLLNFDSPRGTMRVDGDIEPMLERLRRGTGSVTFVETFNRTP